MPPKKISYNNLIDFCLSMEESPGLSGNAAEMFRKTLSDYFFKYETRESKNFNALLNEFELPRFLDNKQSLLDIDLSELEQSVNGETINDSLSGKLMLSTQFLKAFYSHHSPSFTKLPEDVKFEVIDKVKEKNKTIVDAFNKLVIDKEKDRNRKVITLVALILKNVHRKTGRPLKTLNEKADDIIKSLFNNIDDVFTADERQVSDLRDDSKIKDLIKKFFIIKHYDDIKELSGTYKSELERYIKRGAKASQKQHDQ